MKIHNYYQILGVPSTASVKEVSRAYRKLAQQHHPDLQSAENRSQAEARMKMLNEAYEVLRDPSRREEYDRRFRRQFAHIASTRHARSSVASKSRSIGKITSLGMDIISISFLLVGGYFIYFVWAPLYADISSALSHPNEFLLLAVWWFFVGRMAFRYLPFKRLK